MTLNEEQIRKDDERKERRMEEMMTDVEMVSSVREIKNMCIKQYKEHKSCNQCVFHKVVRGVSECCLGSLPYRWDVPDDEEVGTVSEYIDKDVMREILTKELNSTLVFEKDDLGFRNALQFAINRLNKIPPADVAPVVHGKWVMKSKRIVDKETGETKQHYIWHECSKCRKHNQSKSNYCPNCGAKMDESEDSGND